MEKFPGHGLCPDFSGPGRPARSMHIQVLRRISIPRHFQFENRSLVDFQIGNGPHSVLRVRFLAPRIRFYLHKEFRAAGIRFYLHKE